MFEIGQKVTVKHPTGDAPSGDSPGGIFASPGEVLVVRSINEKRHYPISVSHEHITDNSFGVTADEIEPIQVIKGKELALGMKVQRVADSRPVQHPMIIFADGPYYKNPLYGDDDFVLIHEQAV